MSYRAVAAGTFALLAGISSLALLLEVVSERHSPGGLILLVGFASALLIIAITLLAALLFERDLKHRAARIDPLVDRGSEPSSAWRN
jgi:hypothetical protein